MCGVRAVFIKALAALGLAITATSICAGFLALMIYLDGGAEALGQFLTIWR